LDLSPDRGDEAAKFREWFRIRCQEGESRRSGVNRGGPAWLGSLCLKRWWPQRDLIELAQFKCAISLRVDSRLRSAGASALNHSPNGRTGNTSHRQIPLGHHCVTALPADRVPKHDSLVTVIESDCNSLGFSAVGTFYRACSYAGRDCRGRGGSGRREGSCHAARRAPMLRGNTPRRFPHRIGSACVAMSPRYAAHADPRRRGVRIRRQSVAVATSMPGGRGIESCGSTPTAWPRPQTAS